LVAFPGSNTTSPGRLITLNNVIYYQIWDNNINEGVPDQVVQKENKNNLPTLFFNKTPEAFFPKDTQPLRHKFWLPETH